MSLRRISLSAVALLVALISALPAAAADVLEQTFEHETWDEQPDQELADAITALREAHKHPDQEHSYLVDVRGLDMTRTRRTDGYSGYGLEVTIPVGGYRGFGPYARLPEPVDEAWFRYYVYPDDFRPVSSGKLPGPADASLSPSAKGCNPSTADAPGWSARLMFDTVGTAGAGPGEVPIGYYLYHLGQAGDCGDEMMFGALRQRRWTCIEGHVRMNTPGASDGMIEAWVDGQPSVRREGLAFRRPGESVAIREMWDNVYFGGRYATPNQLRLVLDDMVVSDTGRIGCIDPFADDDGTVHEGDLTELYARRLLFGCGEGLACPLDRLTRAEFAAMIHRLTGLPGGPDAFTDDDGHWAEADVDALAAAGITRGCGDGLYCPDRLMLRMEAGTFTLRADDRLRAVEVLAPLPDWPPPGPPPEIPLEEREWLPIPPDE